MTRARTVISQRVRSIVRNEQITQLEVYPISYQIYIPKFNALRPVTF